MFVEWGFLLTEIWVLLALAALIGLLAGWLIWGRRSGDAHLDDYGRMRSAFGTQPAAAPQPTPAPVVAPAVAAAPEPVAVVPMPEPDPELTPEPDMPAITGQKPAGLEAARGGMADDLTQIKGIGVKLQALCNRLGFYHFDQIANWTEDEIAWVDDNLEGFKGRVTRDNWVAQARDLARAG